MSNPEENTNEHIEDMINKNTPSSSFLYKNELNDPDKEVIRGSKNENISSIINRRNRILNHIRREQFLICFPNTDPFVDQKNGFECFLAYHFFAIGTPEDFMFLNTKSRNKVFDIDHIVEYSNKSIADIENRLLKNSNIILDLIDIEERKFVLNKYTTYVEELSKRKNAPKRKFVPTSLNRKDTEKRKNSVVKLRLNEEDFKSHKYVRAMNEKLFFKKN